MKKKRLLQYYRQKAGITQEEVAEKLGVHLNTVHYWESGSRRLKPSYIKQLAELYCVSVDDILDATEEE